MIDTNQNTRYSIADMLHRISVKRYHAMIAAGIFTTEDHIELLDGMIVEKMPKNPHYSNTTRILKKILSKMISDNYFVDSQEPLTLKESEPEPDLMVVRGDQDQFFSRHPEAADVELVIEVSDSTLKSDRSIKFELYAQAGIPRYWIVNVQEQTLEVYCKPVVKTAVYAEKVTYTLGDRVPVELEENIVGKFFLADIFPKD